MGVFDMDFKRIFESVLNEDVSELEKELTNLKIKFSTDNISITGKTIKIKNASVQLDDKTELLKIDDHIINSIGEITRVMDIPNNNSMIFIGKKLVVRVYPVNGRNFIEISDMGGKLEDMANRVKR